MPILLISDLHLSKERPAVTRAFFRFLEEHARHAEALYILGDLFEAWIGDDDPEPLARDTIAALRGLTDQGTELYFLHGNRDFLVDKRFSRETGCTLLPDYHMIRANNQNILLCHGDTLCLDDKSYQKFRRKVRNPFYRWLLRHLPLKKRQRIAAEWREKSLAANANKPANIMDVNESEVERQLAIHNADILIHGHTHRPDVHEHANGHRIVLGDWESHGWYVSIDGDQLELIDFPIDDKTDAGSAPKAPSITDNKADANPEPAPKKPDTGIGKGHLEKSAEPDDDQESFPGMPGPKALDQALTNVIPIKPADNRPAAGADTTQSAAIATNASTETPAEPVRESKNARNQAEKQDQSRENDSDHHRQLGFDF